MTEFHFIRPFWLLMGLLLLVLMVVLWRRKQSYYAWESVCDSHLLPHLIQIHKDHHQLLLRLLTWLCGGFMVISLAGPTWSRWPVPTYQAIQPRVVVLDLSDSMLAKDITPDRLTRAKFKLHDLINTSSVGQLGLVAYSEEPFVVSPLTEDSQTISALIPALTSDIMPVQGQRLDLALETAGKLITQAGYQRGQILVLTSDPPTSKSIEEAKQLAKRGLFTSIMPVTADVSDQSFQNLAAAGQGRLIPFSDRSDDLLGWASGKTQAFVANLDNGIPVWRDQGRWFLVPALLFLLPSFRRGWQRT